MSDVVMLMTLSSVVSPGAGSGVTGTTEPMAVPSLLVSKARESVVMSSLTAFSLASAMAVSGLAVPSLTGSGATHSMAVHSAVESGLAVPAVAKSMAVPSLVSRSGSSVPVSSSDVFGVAKLTAKPGLLVAIVAECLTVPGLIVPRVVKSMAIAGPTIGVALWRCSRGLGIPLDRGLPLPGEALVGTWADTGTGCL